MAIGAASDDDGAIGAAWDDDDGAIGAASEEDVAIGAASDDEVAIGAASDDDDGAIGAASDEELTGATELEDELAGATGVVVAGPRLKIQMRPMITITATTMIIQVLRFIGLSPWVGGD